MPSSACAAIRNRLGLGAQAATRGGGRPTTVRLPAPGRGRAFVASGRRKGSSLDPAWLSPDQLRIAQNSIASPGNSPATCMRTPPELLSCSHRSSV